jgi:flagellar basal-body rod protein FlgB
MDPLSALLIGKALDGLALRSTIISQNIANANSADYVPRSVAFETQLRNAAAQGPGAIQAVHPRVELARGSFANGEMRLDLEMAASSQTALRYAALVDILNRQMQIARSAIRGGQ